MRTKLLLFLMFTGSVAMSQQTDLQLAIASVENNLMPYVPVKGFPGWNITERMKKYKVPGLSIAVIKDYKIHWAKGYGWADTIKKTPVTPNTLFSAGSISKFVMAVAALKLVENKKLSLDGCINDYLQSWKIGENEFTKKTPISLRMLLSHTAGTSQSSYFGFTPEQKLPTIIEILNGDAVSETRRVVVNSEPAKEFRYSGGGSMIAQMAMMNVCKKDFCELMDELVFGPIGMKSSTFEQPLPKRFEAFASKAYSAASWFKGMPYVYPQQAAAGLYTTPTDLAKFFIDIQKSYAGKGHILSAPTTKLMLQPQASVSRGAYNEDIGIGPFLMQRTDNVGNEGLYFEFTGVNAGFLAYGIASVEGGNGVIIMLNSGDDVNGLGKEIRRAVAKAYHWKNFLPEAIVPVQWTEEQLNSYCGRYRKGVDEVVYLRSENGYFIENINEGSDIYCFPVANDTIAFTDYTMKGIFEKDISGTPTSLRYEWQQQTMPKMSANEFTPSEYLKNKNYPKAKEGFSAMKLNEYEITYRAYDLLNKKNVDPLAVKVLLEVAVEQHPDSAIVHCRWGDYYVSIKQTHQAINSYEQALKLDPSDKITAEKLLSLK